MRYVIITSLCVSVLFLLHYYSAILLANAPIGHVFLCGIFYLLFIKANVTCVQVSLKNDEIKRLKANIKTVINLAENAHRKTQLEATNQQKSDTASFDSRKSALEEGIAGLSKKYREMLAEHREREQELRKVHVHVCTIHAPVLMCGMI